MLPSLNRQSEVPVAVLYQTSHEPLNKTPDQPQPFE